MAAYGCVRPRLEDGLKMRRSHRIALLQEAYLFADLPEASVTRLAQSAELRPFNTGDLLFSEGTTAAAIFVIASGTLEEQTAGPNGPLPVSLACRADVLGEEALRPEMEGHYASSGRALTDGLALAIPLASAAEAVRTPEAAAALEADRKLLDRVRLIKGATAFAGLPIDAVRRLAATITEHRLQRGEALVVEGEPGETCFLVEQGRFIVSHAAEPGRCLARLGPGALIGEVSLLAGEPRRATVRAEVPSEVLALQRVALLAALADCGRTAARFAAPTLARIRPRRRDTVESHQATSPEGEPVTVLKDRERRAYFQLSELGQFVWARLDGRTPVSRIIAEALRERGTFAPEAIGGIVSGLLQAGMATLADGSDGRLLHRRAGAVRGGAPNWLNARVEVVGEARAERWSQRLHDGLWPLATPTGAGALFLLGALGLLAALLRLTGADLSSSLLPGPATLAIGGLLAVTIHEAAHMVAMRAANLQVHGIGLGWSWFFPVAYVDTTDIWIAGPRQRLQVALAGPLANFALGGGLSLAAIAVSPSSMAGPLWTHAFVNFVVALLALTPSGSSDGAQILEAWLGGRGSPTATQRGLSVLHGLVIAATAFLVLTILVAESLRVHTGSAAPFLLAFGAAVIALGLSRGVASSAEM